MTDEEKEAIDYLQLCYDLSTITNESLSKLGIVLNLIEKQSKIIAKLYKSLEDEIGTIVNLGILLDENAREKKDVTKYIDEVQLFLNTLNYNYISKDKIKPVQIIDLDGKIHHVYKIEED